MNDQREMAYAKVWEWCPYLKRRQTRFILAYQPEADMLNSLYALTYRLFMSMSFGDASK